MEKRVTRLPRRITSFLMAMVMTLSLVMGVSITAHAATKTLADDENYTAQDGDVLTGSTSGTVTIPNNANITLSDVTITGGIVCAGTAEITLVGNNSVSGDIFKAGIQVGGSGTTLTIKGNGSLTANGSNDSAGIGLSRAWCEDAVGGDIVIEGGNITANGGNYGAGIGTGVAFGNDGSNTASLGNITIKGGTVIANGGSDANGIGTGYCYGGCTNEIGTVTICAEIEKIDASSISGLENVVYMSGETNVTVSKNDYFKIVESSGHCIIVPKDDTDYTITIDDEIEHGSISGITMAKYSDNVTITATPDFGYRFINLIVKDENNNNVSCRGRSFFMPKSNVTVSAVFEEGVQGTRAYNLYHFDSGSGHQIKDATIYDGVTTVKFRENLDIASYGIYEDDPTSSHVISTFTVDLVEDEEFHDIKMNDADDGTWHVSVQKTVPVIDYVPKQLYTGNEIKPEPLVLAGSLNLTKGTDYEYTYTNNTDVGTAKVIVTFKGEYAALGSVEKEFSIIRGFTYSATDATITATSIDTGTQETLTIVAPAKTIYEDRNSAKATLDGLDAFNTATDLKIKKSNIKYVGRGNTTYEESSNAPVDAGDYTASITAGGKTASVDYTIAPATAEIDKVTVNDYEAEYDGQYHGISVSAPVGATVLYSSEENGEYTETQVKLKQVGNSNVYWKVYTDSNHEPVIGHNTVTINPKKVHVKLSNTNVDLTATGATLPTPSIVAGDIVGSDNLNVDIDRDEVYSIQKIDNKDVDYKVNLNVPMVTAGRYKLKPILSSTDGSDSNYEIASGDEWLYFTISDLLLNTKKAAEEEAAKKAAEEAAKKNAKIEVPNWTIYKGNVVAVDKNGKVVKKTGIATWRGYNLLIANGVLYKKPVFFLDKSDGKYKYFVNGIQAKTGDTFIPYAGKLIHVTNGEVNRELSFVKWNGKYVVSYNGAAATNFSGTINFRGYKVKISKGVLVGLSR